MNTVQDIIDELLDVGRTLNRRDDEEYLSNEQTRDLAEHIGGLVDDLGEIIEQALGDVCSAFGFLDNAKEGLGDK